MRKAGIVKLSVCERLVSEQAFQLGRASGRRATTCLSPRRNEHIHDLGNHLRQRGDLIVNVGEKQNRTPISIVEGGIWCYVVANGKVI